jgi:hypothetical protein
MSIPKKASDSEDVKGKGDKGKDRKGKVSPWLSCPIRNVLSI